MHPFIMSDLSDERLSANVPSALQRHLPETLCQHLFWTVTLWHYLKLNLILIISRLFLANWPDLSASASEAIAPQPSTNRVIIIIITGGAVNSSTNVTLGTTLESETMITMSSAGHDSVKNVYCSTVLDTRWETTRSSLVHSIFNHCFREIRSSGEVCYTQFDITYTMSSTGFKSGEFKGHC